MTEATTDQLRTNTGAAARRSGARQLIGFHILDNLYLVDIASVEEVVRVGAITQLPESPRCVLGVSNLRNAVIPIVDLRLRFGLPPAEESEERRILVLSVDERMIGLLVDAVDVVHHIAPDDIDPPPPTVGPLDELYLAGLVDIDDRMAIVIDPVALLGDKSSLFV